MHVAPTHQKELVVRLLGCTALAVPLPETQISGGGIAMPNKYKKPNMRYRVIAVGPGAWRVKKKRRVQFFKPCVEVGDEIITRANVDGVKFNSQHDGTGSLIINAFPERRDGGCVEAIVGGKRFEE
jgi:co-chaperonin GroES (HSP10)